MKMKGVYVLACLLVICSVCFADIGPATATTNNVVKKKIAVIGAGFSGGSVAYYTNLYGNNKYDVYVFDQNDRVGGRVKVHTIGGTTVEVGGDAWSSVNTYLQEESATLNVPLVTDEYDGNGETGYYEGHQQWNIFNVDPNDEENLEIQIEGFLESLQANYDERDGTSGGTYAPTARPTIPASFDTINQFLSYGNLNAYTPINMTTLGQEGGISYDFLWNTVLPVTRGIYDQDLGISAFGGIVALLPALTPAFSVQGGNYLLVQALLNASRAHVCLNTQITSVTKVLGGYVLTSNSSIITTPILDFTFDAVVVATPWEFTGINFVNIALPKIPTRSFVHWYVTLIMAKSVNAAAFGLDANDLPANIFTTGNSTAPFVVLYPVGQSADLKYVIFKIFSNADVSIYLPLWFTGIEETFVQYWPYTFPNLSPAANKQYQPIHLDTGLYYTGGIESVASAMEMSTIAGRNAALLITQNH